MGQKINVSGEVDVGLGGGGSPGDLLHPLGRGHVVSDGELRDRLWSLVVVLRHSP